MSKIGIDARLINQTGVGVYIRNLLHYLDQGKTSHEFIIYMLPQDIEKFQFIKKHFTKRAAPYRWHSVDEQRKFLTLLNEDNLDLVHFTYFSFPYFYNRPFVITIHDLTPLLFKTGKATTLPSPIYRIKHTGYKSLLRRGMKKAQSVLVPSNAVKSDIISFFGDQYADKITVTYEGIDFELMKMKPDNSILQDVHKPFFLYIGNSYPHKNIENLLRAFSKITSDHHLVLVGPKDFFASNITRFIKEHNLQKRVMQLFNISQEQKVALYKNAQALVQPSLSEGFGLPIIEAEFFNCPVVASTIAVFDEILPKNTLRFDPHSINSIKEALEKVTSSKQPLTKLNQNLFSFEKMTKETLEIYNAYL